MKQWFYKVFHFSSAVQRRLSKRISTTGRVILLCLFLSGVFGDANQSMAYQIFSFLLCLVTIEIGFSLVFRLRFSATRHLPRFASVGSPLKYRITIHHHSPKSQTALKLWEEFVDPRPSLREFLTISEPNESKRNAFDRAVGYYRWQWAIARNLGAIAKAIDLPSLQPNSPTEVVYEILPTQ